ncbi:MAG: transglycosylase SLT domain-containing protein [bacterium]|nr:transglycosylase SLT domain-containing protein [bacterium]
MESIDPAVIAAKVCDVDEKSKECVVALIKKYADQYDFPEKMALAVASCESEFKTTALGDRGKAYGIYQFHKPTFEMFSKKLGEKLNYHDTEDNIKLAIWALSQDKGHHWTCYRKISAR